MSFEAESNSELTVIIPTYQLHFWFPVQNKIHKQKNLSHTRTGILGSIAGPCDFLPAWSDEFQKVCKDGTIVQVFSVSIKIVVASETKKSELC